MKINKINPTSVLLTIENAQDAMFVKYLSIASKMPEDAPVKEDKRRKRYLIKRTCEICGRPCKGRSGFGVHLKRKHGVSLKHWESKETTPQSVSNNQTL